MCSTSARSTATPPATLVNYHQSQAMVQVPYRSHTNMAIKTNGTGCSDNEMVIMIVVAAMQSMVLKIVVAAMQK